MFNKDRGGIGRRLHKFRALIGKSGYKVAKVKLEYLEHAGCPDCKELADQFWRVVHDYAGWMVIPPVGNRNEEQFFEGVAVQVNFEGDDPEVTKWRSDAADALKTELPMHKSKQRFTPPDSMTRRMM